MIEAPHRETGHTWRERVVPHIMAEYEAWRIANALGSDPSDATMFLSRWLAHKLEEARGGKP